MGGIPAYATTKSYDDFGFGYLIYMMCMMSMDENDYDDQDELEKDMRC